MSAVRCRVEGRVPTNQEAFAPDARRQPTHADLVFLFAPSKQAADGDGTGKDSTQLDPEDGWREASEICTLDSNVYEEKGWRISATLTFSPVAGLAS